MVTIFEAISKNNERDRKHTEEIDRGKTLAQTFPVEDTEHDESAECVGAESVDRGFFEVDRSALVQEEVSNRDREINDEPQAGVVGKLPDEILGIGKSAAARFATGVGWVLFLEAFFAIR